MARAAARSSPSKTMLEKGRSESVEIFFFIGGNYAGIDAFRQVSDDWIEKRCESGQIANGTQQENHIPVELAAIIKPAATFISERAGDK
jgi:hypothetical protein